LDEIQIDPLVRLRLRVLLEFAKSIFAIHDFSKYYHNGIRYNDLMISVLQWDPKAKTYKWIYLDFVQKGEGSGEQDYFFVRAVWRWLLRLDDTLEFDKFTCSEEIDPRTLFDKDEVVIFSDGAGQHFKQKKTICFWAEIQRDLGKLIEIHFFGSYHGHNVCDSHSAHVKRIILKKIRELGQDIFVNEIQLVEALGSLKNTHIFRLKAKAIDRSVGAPKIISLINSQLKGIRSFHHFHLTGDGENHFLECFLLSKDEKPFRTIRLPTEQEVVSGTYRTPANNGQFDSLCSEEEEEINEDGDYFEAQNDQEDEYFPQYQPLRTEFSLEELEDSADLETDELFLPPVSQSQTTRSGRTSRMRTGDFVFYGTQNPPN